MKRNQQVKQRVSPSIIPIQRYRPRNLFRFEGVELLEDELVDVRALLYGF